MQVGYILSEKILKYVDVVVEACFIFIVIYVCVMIGLCGNIDHLSLRDNWTIMFISIDSHVAHIQSTVIG